MQRSKKRGCSITSRGARESARPDAISCVD